ncbi:hypothetical protein RHIZ_04745 [Rhizobium skierniewicense]|uniref:Pycsar system effector family protein n=1 Tax=Rhizobium/Agrobacterium group TaxID=227290 RepID=UPI000DE50431|nr:MULTISPECIES: Pycsar system effector family protein [Rhizobium/Agrobacterium group]MCI9865249.1 hypothetical protein [Rhizobium skierniewicense]NTF07673.1 hypothetical protein [Agrobacterium rubi]NTF19711.1 hypothetical protein [Agrobacterium rubi]NTF26676.1 hypothetical protein [Agrobacterium rubi]UHS56415.1 hypothetical protein HRS00_06135 [Agrobacterium vaccinii]
MAKNDQQEAYEKLMSANHGRMIDFVKFAETKNAALLTFSSVWIGALINLLKSAEALPFNYGNALVVALILLFLAAATCLISLLPRFLKHFYKREDDRKNLLYFGDIKESGAKDYPLMAEKEYRPQDGDSASQTYLHDLAVQTAIHASIAHRKFKLFNWAASLVLLAFVVMGIPPSLAVARWAFSHLPC